MFEEIVGTREALRRALIQVSKVAPAASTVSSQARPGRKKNSLLSRFIGGEVCSDHQKDFTTHCVRSTPTKMQSMRERTTQSARGYRPMSAAMSACRNWKLCPSLLALD
jgi:hypothetical protein